MKGAEGLQHRTTVSMALSHGVAPASPP